MNWRAIANALVDTFAIFYRLRILRFYDRKHQLVRRVSVHADLPMPTLFGRASGTRGERPEVRRYDLARRHPVGVRRGVRDTARRAPGRGSRVAAAGARRHDPRRDRGSRFTDPTRRWMGGGGAVADARPVRRHRRRTDRSAPLGRHATRRGARSSPSRDSGSAVHEYATTSGPSRKSMSSPHETCSYDGPTWRTRSTTVSSTPTTCAEPSGRNRNG